MPTSWSQRLTRPEVLLALLLALVALLYAPGTQGPFHLDDWPNLVGNKLLHPASLSASDLWQAASSGRAGPTGRPVSLFTFALNHYFSGGPDSFAIKATNVVLHLLTALALYLLLRALFSRPNTSSNGRWLPLLITAVWVLHPLQVSTVLYGVQRMTMLSALFVLLGLWSFVRGRMALEEGRARVAQAWLLIGFTGAALLAVYSKENGALIIPLALLIEFTRFRDGGEASNRDRWILRAALIVPSALLFVYLAKIPFGPAPTTRDFTPLERMLTEGRVLLFYLSQLAWPDIGRMSLFHTNWEVSRSLWQPWTTLPALLLWFGVIAATVIALFRRRWIWLAFGCGWFLIGHLLESTTVPLELVFEHRNYLPSVGVAIALVVGASQLTKLIQLKPRLVAALALSVLVLLGSQLQWRASLWSNSGDMLAHELLNRPDEPRAWIALAFYVVQLGMYDDAIEFYRQADKLEPNEAGNLLGVLSVRVHALHRFDNDELLAVLENKLLNNPITPFTSGQLRVYFELLLRNSARLGEALVGSQRLLGAALDNSRWRIPSSRGIAFFHYGALSLMRGDPGRAVAAFEEGLKLKPNVPVVRIDLARLHLNAGNVNAAAAALSPLGDMELGPRLQALFQSLSREIKTRRQ